MVWAVFGILKIVCVLLFSTVVRFLFALISWSGVRVPTGVVFIQFMGVCVLRSTRSCLGMRMLVVDGYRHLILPLEVVKTKPLEVPGVRANEFLMLE